MPFISLPAQVYIKLDAKCYEQWARILLPVAGIIKIDAKVKERFAMVEALPFQALMYDLETIPDLSSVICPPYDVISDNLRNELYEKDSFNIVRLEYSKELGSNEDRYDRAAQDLQDWIEQGILKSTKQAKFYLLTQSYIDAYGAERVRKVLMARVRLEKFSEGGVLPHEFTIPKAKKDRLDLLTKCATNFSPIMAVYRDSGGRVNQVLNSERVKKSVLTSGVIADEGEFSLVEIVEPEDIRSITDAFSDIPVLIADGHHRYETALEYSLVSGATGARYVMMGLIALDDPGLDIQGYHRVVSGITEDTLTALLERVQENFEEYRAINFPDDISSRARELQSSLVSPDRIKWDVILLHSAGNVSFLKAREDRIQGNRLGKLPIRLLEECLEAVTQEGALPVSPSVDYEHDVVSAVARVSNSDGHSAVGFIMGSLGVDLFEEVVMSEGRLPRKSTYFYPKLPAGVVMYPLWSD